MKNQIEDLDRLIQVVRMTIALKRPDGEAVQAACELRDRLISIDGQARRQSVDAKALAAVRIAMLIANAIVKTLTTSDKEANPSASTATKAQDED